MEGSLYGRVRSELYSTLAKGRGSKSAVLLALNWKDADFQTKQTQVTSSIEHNVVGAGKTENSQKPVSAHDGLVEALRKCQRQTPIVSSAWTGVGNDRLVRHSPKHALSWQLGPASSRLPEAGSALC